MRLVFLGSPGVGKGTQAKRLTRAYPVVHIATGDILRAAILQETGLGREAKSYVNAGQLVPDALVIRMVEERFLQDDIRMGFILDGFPRTEEQAEALSAISGAMPLDAVLHFELKEEEQILRLSGRRSCPQCHEIYHIVSRPPKQEGVCDLCPTPLMHRKDDRPEVVIERLIAYKNETAPLIAYYETRGCLHRIDATGTVEEVEQLVHLALFEQSSTTR